MARRKQHDAQVDPFTAGEPTLPWDEPGVFDGLFNGIEPETCIQMCIRDRLSSSASESPSSTWITNMPSPTARNVPSDRKSTRLNSSHIQKSRMPSAHALPLPDGSGAQR